MKRRLRIYGFGLGLGLLMAWALFLRGRNTRNYTSWTPNNRILEEIRTDSTMETSPVFWCELNCLGYSSIEFDALLLDGDVHFGKSQVENWPRNYHVEFETEDKGILVMDLEKTESGHYTVDAISKKGEEISCDC